ncbi:MAG: YkgJ family cysteine cluster protein [Candidatus Obscuribacterales bacterium]|nr:YkgJ family cysteine cluster protein [Candidatus Obscuribacterales bacterium]
MTEEKKPLQIPEGISYNCQGCGRCCSGFAVGLTLKDYDKVKDVDWASMHPQLAGIELFAHREKEFSEGLSPFPIYTKAHADGACPFLVDNLCFIHGTLGESEKPTICQMFPYTFVGTPKGVFAGVSHSSMASVRNLGRPLVEQREMLEGMLELNKQLQAQLKKEAGKTDDNVSMSSLNLAPGIPISWDEYFLIEERMLNLTRQEPFGDTCQMWLSAGEILAEAIRLKSTEQDISLISQFKPNLSIWQDRVPTSFENLMFTLLCFRGLTWPLIKRRRIQSNLKPASRLDILRYVVGVLITKKMEFPNCGLVSIEKSFAEKFDALSPEIDHFMRQYLYLKLFGKTYFGSAMGGLSVVAGFNHLVATALVSLIYGKARAMQKGEHEIGIADLYESVLLLDKQMVSVSQSSGQMALMYDQGFASPRIFSRLLARMERNLS